MVHYTPPHAGWVNQVELFFSILQRKVLANGDFVSRDDLIAKLLGFVAEYDRTAKTFQVDLRRRPAQGCLMHTRLTSARRH